MSKIGIFRGHNTPHNGGAVGIRKEEDLINEVASLLIPRLRALGNTVIDCTPSTDTGTIDSLRRRCDTANNNKVDFVISIHFNAFNGSASGCEVLYVSSTGKKLAEPVQREIAKLGYIDRGLKFRDGLYVLNHTKAPCILVECAFCDAKRDMDIFDASKMADAICKGITGKTTKAVTNVIVTTKPTAAPTLNTENMYRIRKSWADASSQIKAFSELDNALAFIKTVKGYTVFDEDGKVVASSSVATPVVNSGNAWIKRLQTECNKQGFSNQKVDGWYGENTVNGCPTMRQGANGNLTKLLQEKLNKLTYNTNGIDGIYGATTQNAICNFQTNHGLSRDGICGKGTWREIIKQ